MDTTDREHQRRYQLRRRYAHRHGLHPGSVWELAPDAELTYAERTSWMPMPAQTPRGPLLAHCDTWQEITQLPHVCERCGQRFFEET